MQLLAGVSSGFTLYMVTIIEIYSVKPRLRELLRERLDGDVPRAGHEDARARREPGVHDVEDRRRLAGAP